MKLQRKIADQTHFRRLFHNSDRGSNNTAKEPTTTPTATTNDSSADTDSMQPLTRTVSTRTGLAPEQQDVNNNSSSNNNDDAEYHGKNNNNGDDDDINVTDADASIVMYLKRQHSAKRSRVVVARILLVAMAGIFQHVQHLHEMATKESKPGALQKTVSQLRQRQ
jgi:hypothetical protein